MSHPTFNATTQITVYPAIGIARVGDSQGFYIGPETACAMPTDLTGQTVDQNGLRDAEQKMKRQAARFSLYATDDQGQVFEVTPATPGVKRIEWTVHLANKKSIWYEFQTNPGELGYAPNHPLRNADITDPAQRQGMMIDPGPRQVVAQPNQQQIFFASFDDSQSEIPHSFPPAHTKPYAITTLGDLSFDAKGNLLVVGGHGRSGCQMSKDNCQITAYANNDGWFDDTSDGPVDAQITLEDGQVIEAKGAWVIAGPPAYAPEVANMVTLYDTIFDTAVCKLGARPDIFAQGMWKKGADGYKPSFVDEILPLIKRGDGYPWVVAIPPKPHRLQYDVLGDPDPGYDPMRQRILNYLRAPGDENVLIDPSRGGTMMPYLAGDGCIGTTNETKSRYMRLTDTQYFMLEQWANGYFRTESAPVNHPGEAISRGVLENCVGGPFSPGIEMTWVSRLPQIYAEPLRIRKKPQITFPLSLDWDPLVGLEPGDVTKFMAIPWQADFNLCSSQPIQGRTLWWWPAQRPLNVYTPLKEEIDFSQPLQQLVEGKQIKQVAWVGEDYNMNGGSYLTFPTYMQMVEHWKELGFIINVSRDPEQPLLVEVARTLPRAGLDSTDS
ncbi:conserved hypothetical protein [Magnetococcus marinus MC-1]|uniref:L-lysine 6-oxidase n=1 Tax=Magnetococcus marinus (strain ATCC BAA-1437 / JCM 17883 / MC-1) TaxID=156889 RepID=A0L4C4_MAGMM|nr:LodA/GoxA family CTQ-dependent oxidase [Magnetococcus marinus]ABK42817.1 conserved hypothetical protein [Magnetococcus marinus MC-1]